MIDDKLRVLISRALAPQGDKLTDVLEISWARTIFFVFFSETEIPASVFRVFLCREMLCGISTHVSTLAEPVVCVWSRF